MADKRFYWLKLQQDFFQDDTIKWIEDQPNGKDYVIFYLKLCLKSLSNDGHLIRYVGEMLMPYDVTGLAKLTDSHIDTVRVAMELFIKIGLVEHLETGEIYMKQIDEMVGTETQAAARKRRQRAIEKAEAAKQIEGPENTGRDIVTDESQKVTQSKRKNLELDLDLESEREEEAEEEKSAAASDINVHLFYQQNIGVESAHIIQDLDMWIDDLTEEVVQFALEKTVENNAQYSFAKGIMRSWAQKGINNIDAAKAESDSRSRSTWNKQGRTETLPDWAEEENTGEEIDEEADAALRERVKKIRNRKNKKTEVVSEEDDNGDIEVFY